MSTEKQGQNYKFYKFLAWALLGAILTYIVCAMTLTTDHTVDTPFYNAGDISEVSITQFRRDVEREQGYQDASGTIDLEQGEYYCWVTLTDYSKAWNYLCVRIDDLSSESIEWKVTYQKLKNDEVTDSVAETYELTEGMNVLSLPDQKFDRVRIDMYGENGTTFSVGEVEFRENPPIAVTGLTIAASILTGVCYLVLSGILLIVYRRSHHKRHIPFYGAIEILQEFYLAVAGRIAALQEKFRINPKRRRIIRTCLFLGMLYYCMIVIFEKNYSPEFRFKGLIVLLFLCAIIVFSIEGKPKKKNWNNPLVWGWLAVAVMMCISDFVTQKGTDYYPFFGYILLAFVGFFIFVWNNMKDRGEILEDFARAVHVLIWIALAYCILFRPHDPAVRYSGFTNNPNGLGVYTAIFFAVVIGSLEHAIRTNAKRRILFLYIIEGCLVFSLAWKSQSATALIAIILVGVIWLVRMIVYTIRNKKKKALVGILVCAVILFLPLHAALSFGLTHVSEALGTTVNYEDEIFVERKQIGTVAYAADTESENVFTDNRLYQKATSSTLAEATSGRTYIYKEYLRDLNWFGHDTWPNVFGADNPRNAHNEILNQAYRYGIFTAIPYIVMLVAVLVRTWRYGSKKTIYAALPFYVCLAAIVESMGDVVMNPFQWPTWFGLYLLMGCVFSEESLTEEEDDPGFEKITNNSQNLSTPS
ncbi:MAG: hypothetical protein LIO56_07330 [Lachnospiraceae bacterium]|nr:hypothetical protein [Lachnospiraceae bacterium]